MSQETSSTAFLEEVWQFEINEPPTARANRSNYRKWEESVRQVIAPVSILVESSPSDLIAIHEISSAKKVRGRMREERQPLRLGLRNGTEMTVRLSADEFAEMLKMGLVASVRFVNHMNFLYEID